MQVEERGVATGVRDGSSDIYHVIPHANRPGGLTIAVSENKYITTIADRHVLSDDALSVLAPILKDVLHWDTPNICALFESRGAALREWNKIRTDALSVFPVAIEVGAAIQ